MRKQKGSDQVSKKEPCALHSLQRLHHAIFIRNAEGIGLGASMKEPSVDVLGLCSLNMPMRLITSSDAWRCQAIITDSACEGSRDNAWSGSDWKQL